jgi:hypothetical protein
MSIFKEMTFEARTLEVGVLARTIKDVVCSLGREKDPIVRFALSESLPDGTYATRELSTFADLELLCNLEGRRVDLLFYDRNKGAISLEIRGGGSRTYIHVGCEIAERLKQVCTRVVESLGLKEAPPLPSRDEGISDIEDRLNALEKAVFDARRKLRCFLSYSFTPENEVTAFTVQKFLTLLDVEVTTGTSYEPKRVSEKVISMLKASQDFIVALVLRDGQSMWTRDEIATAQREGMAIVPVVETGTSFASGIFGDLEYIPFEPGHIGDAFLKLLEAVRFLKKDRPGPQ